MACQGEPDEGIELILTGIAGLESASSLVYLVSVTAHGREHLRRFKIRIPRKQGWPLRVARRIVHVNPSVLARKQRRGISTVPVANDVRRVPARLGITPLCSYMLNTATPSNVLVRASIADTSICWPSSVKFRWVSAAITAIAADNPAWYSDWEPPGQERLSVLVARQVHVAAYSVVNQV